MLTPLSKSELFEEFTVSLGLSRDGRLRDTFLTAAFGDRFDENILF
jgi:hypothetical protein